MNQKRILSAGLIAILVAVSGIALAGAQARIVGKVTDGKGTPLEGVTITVTTPSLGNFKVVLTTDKDGKWGTILNDSTIKYDYLFEMKGYLTVNRPGFKVPIASTGELERRAPDAGPGGPEGGRQGSRRPVHARVQRRGREVPGGRPGRRDRRGEEGDRARAREVRRLRHGDEGRRRQEGLGPRPPVGREGALARGRQRLALRAPDGGLQGEGEQGRRRPSTRRSSSPPTPTSPRSSTTRRSTSTTRGSSRKPSRSCRKILEGAPEYANAHFLLGMACVNLNKIPDMKKHLGEYLRLEPNGKEAATAKEMLEAFK